MTLVDKTKRTFLVVGLITVTSALFAQLDPARDLVNPFIGTGGHGHTFPGACVPNGLVQLGPDTRPDPTEWDGCGGYHYSDSAIYGFSHTHLSGTGVSDLADVLLMPSAAEPSFDPDQYRSSFSHANEHAHAGYYKVLLEEGNISAELTATPHVGVHRYVFETGQEQWVLLDLEHRDKLLDWEIDLNGDHTIVGKRRSSSWATDQQLFFIIRFSRPFDQHRMEPAMTKIGDVHSSRPTKAFVHFAASSEPLIVKVGLSAVSIDGARANLEAEVPHWNFEQVKAETEAAWNEKLNRIQIEGGTHEQRRIFYTALYHCYVAPYIFNDVDGNYRGMDGTVHQADHDVYTVFSLWDTFRGLHPLMTILEPDMVNDWIKTFLLHHEQGGRLPVWELWGNETDCMIGHHSVSVIADAYMKGIRDYDADLAVEAMQASAAFDDPALNAYRERGFISGEDCSESVSRTLEFAYDDACIATFLSQRKVDLSPFQDRSLSYHNLYDPTTGFFRARRNGGFVPDFDPFEVNFHFTEANAWQYSLFVPQDIDGLIALHGGPSGLEAKLDTLFSVTSTTSGREQADITGLIGQYAHGNEPSHHMAYLYNRIGKPEKTRAMVKRIMHEMYADAPDGLSGNEDCGQMSAWFVLSALGFYPISPGIDTRYELGHPLFERATIRLANGKTWELAIDGTSNATANAIGEVPDHITHEELVAGGTIEFQVDRTPKARGSQKTVEPSVLVDRGGAAVAPLIHAPSPSFRGTMEVQVDGRGTCTLVDEGGSRSCPMNKPFIIDVTCAVTVQWSDTYAPVIARFKKIDHDLSIALESVYANQYAASGPNALIDGLRGGTDFRTGEWQGFEGRDVLATIDLGKSRMVDSVGIGTLQDIRSWIWFPEYVDVAWSTNGRMWSSTTLTTHVDRRTEGAMTMELWTGPIAKKARWVKIMAKNAGPCPEWHLGAGGATWIFLDEVMVASH